MKKTAYKNGGQAGKKVALSLLVWAGILLLGVVTVTGLVSQGALHEEMIHTVSILLLFGSTVMGGVIASLGQEGYWITIAAFTAIAYQILIAINIVVFESGLERLGIGTVAVILGAATSLALKLLPIGRQRGTKIKYKIR